MRRLLKGLVSTILKKQTLKFEPKASTAYTAAHEGRGHGEKPKREKILAGLPAMQKRGKNGVFSSNLSGSKNF